MIEAIFDFVMNHPIISAGIAIVLLFIIFGKREHNRDVAKTVRDHTPMKYMDRVIAYKNSKRQEKNDGVIFFFLFWGIIIFVLVMVGPGILNAVLEFLSEHDRWQ